MGSALAWKQALFQKHVVETIAAKYGEGPAVFEGADLSEDLQGSLLVIILSKALTADAV